MQKGRDAYEAFGVAGHDAGHELEEGVPDLVLVEPVLPHWIPLLIYLASLVVVLLVLVGDHVEGLVDLLQQGRGPLDALGGLLQARLERLVVLGGQLGLGVAEGDEPHVEVDAVDLVRDLEALVVLEDQRVDPDKERHRRVQHVRHLLRQDRDQHELPLQREQEGYEGDGRVCKERLVLGDEEDLLFEEEREENVDDLFGVECAEEVLDVGAGGGGRVLVDCAVEGHLDVADLVEDLGSRPSRSR